MNGKQNIPIILLQIIIISIIQIVSSDEQIDILGGICKRYEDVNSTSVYQNNINSILSSFITNSSNSFFFQTSSGAGGDLVNGQYDCRPGVSIATCESCVTTAVRDFNETCSGKKSALKWYQQCMVRYTNETIKATLQTDPVRENWSNYNVSRPDIFPDLLNNTIQQIITVASMSKEHFSYNSTDFTVFEELFGMAWCVPDITENECQTCLTTAFNTMIVDTGGLSDWAYVLFPSCVLRYETAPFIFSDSASPPAPAP